MTDTTDNLDDEIAALFKLPAADFIAARNDLAARLKKARRADDANLVKALARPSVTAWAVNQLYWNHREEFEQLLQASRRYREAQLSRSADIRGPLEARREALSHLSELAATFLRDAGHNPAPDMINRIMTTLEAISASSSPSDGPTPGRLTRDLDPPGFDSLAALMAGAGPMRAGEKPAPAGSANESGAHPRAHESGPSHTEAPAKALADDDAQKKRKHEQMHQAKIAAAKAALQDAEKSLTETSARAEQLDAAWKKADADADQAERELRDLEERVKTARTASHEAAQRSHRIAVEAKEAAKAVETARRNVDKASKEIESLLRE